MQRSGIFFLHMALVSALVVGNELEQQENFAQLALYWIGMKQYKAAYSAKTEN